ncbi:MAG: fucose isomerase [Oscillospiraceae bacterium]|nr:fucose isomerase [Oscillospiraceae bacterium]
MLKHIPKTFTPDLLKLIMEMGHGETILISDGNFPQKAVSSKNIKSEIIYMPVCDISDLLKDILHFFPLDYAVECAAFAMEVLQENQRYGEYKNLIESNGSKLELVERFKFYELAENAAGIIVTADTTRGGNILIKKGVVTNDDMIII